MESNKEDALRCLEIAKKSINEKDYEKAKRMASKSERLYPSSDAKYK